MYHFDHKDKIAVFIYTAIFKLRFMVTANVIWHKVSASNGASPILSLKQGNSVVCKLNRFIQHRVLHEPYHRISIDTEIFMDFCPSLQAYTD